MIMEKESPTTKKHWGPESLLGWRKRQRGEAPSRSVLLMSCVGERGRGRPLLFFFFDALGSESAGAQSGAGRAGCRERSWGGRTPGMDALSRPPRAELQTKCFTIRVKPGTRLPLMLCEEHRQGSSYALVGRMIAFSQVAPRWGPAGQGPRRTQTGAGLGGERNGTDWGRKGRNE